jgi:hypothetical protein
MPSRRLALTLAAVCAPLAAHAETRLNIKPGLWETTLTIAMEGMPEMPEATLQKMPPQQRAQMEAAMARLKQPRTEKSCITAEQIEKGPNFGEPDDPSCKRNISVNSRTEWGMTEVCTGQHPRTLTTHFKAASPESISGQTDVTGTSPRGTPMTSKATFQGKWLGADCGGIKPMEMKK